MLVLPPYSDRFDPMAQYRGTLGPSRSQDHAPMDGTGWFGPGSRKFG